MNSEAQPKIQNFFSADGLTPIQGLHVLLVDDSVVELEIGKRVLANMGYVVTTASDGLEAVQTLGLHSDINLVLMDIHMSEMDGFVATRTIRKIPTHIDTPVIAVTSDESAEIFDMVLESGMNGYIRKSLRSDKLITTLQLIAGKAHHQANISAAQA